MPGGMANIAAASGNMVTVELVLNSLMDVS